MDGEEKRGQIRAGDFEFAKDGPQKQRGRDVQRDIDDVVSGRVLVEQVPFDPETGIGQRPIVGGIGGEPDAV